MLSMIGIGHAVNHQPGCDAIEGSKLSFETAEHRQSGQSLAFLALLNRHLGGNLAERSRRRAVRSVRNGYASTGVPDTAFFAAFLPYFLMNSSVLWRAMSSGYCSSGDFMKFDDCAGSNQAERMPAAAGLAECCVPGFVTPAPIV